MKKLLTMDVIKGKEDIEKRLKENMKPDDVIAMLGNFDKRIGKKLKQRGYSEEDLTWLFMGLFFAPEIFEEDPGYEKCGKLMSIIFEDLAAMLCSPGAIKWCRENFMEAIKEDREKE